MMRPQFGWWTSAVAISGGLIAGSLPDARAEQAETVTGVARAGRALRELNTDRPDATESAFTIDPGHVQIEADFFNHRRDSSDGERLREWSVGATNVRYGVSPNAELGIFLEPWTRQVIEPNGAARITHAGFGDITLRAKLNFKGNDGGPFTCGLIVDVTLPTAARGLGDERAGGALLLPWSVDLAAGWSLAAMTGVEWRRQSTDDSFVVVNTASFGHAITKALGGYLEVTSAAGDGAHVATFDAGLTFQANENLQFDCGVNIGISRAADDFVVFAGVARRF